METQVYPQDKGRGGHGQADFRNGLPYRFITCRSTAKPAMGNCFCRLRDLKNWELGFDGVTQHAELLCTRAVLDFHR